VYRTLKDLDQVSSPVFHIVPAKDKYEKQTKEVNELWQTDFTHLKVHGWGPHYISTVLDDYSRYILAWKLFKTMAAGGVRYKPELAYAKSNLERVKVRHHLRPLSENGPCYVSHEVKRYLQRRRIEHIQGAPYHPMTQGKIERYHRSMKNVTMLQNYYYPWDLEQAIQDFVDYNNHQRYRESLDNRMPEDVNFGRVEEGKSRRE
jgi:putative transposase